MIVLKVRESEQPAAALGAPVEQRP
jgi:hypothetical protein